MYKLSGNLFRHKIFTPLSGLRGSLEGISKGMVPFSKYEWHIELMINYFQDNVLQWITNKKEVELPEGITWGSVNCIYQKSCFIDWYNLDEVIKYIVWIDSKTS